MLSQKEVIEKIRKDEFYIGTGFNIDSIKRKFNNALTKLSDDLYSKDIHFVLELIQNADDNKYESDEIPVLKFIIEPDKILIQNNEVGFAEENILALCSVGESTKTKQDGYIGEKGIGFKSVFKISDEPQIFSKGFHFKFKRIDKDYGLGYIVPYWIEHVPGFVDGDLTNILLPLNNDAKEEISKFSEIEPELLLFLRKLHRVEIHNKIDNVFRSYAKTEENGKIKLSGNEIVEYYKLVSQVLNVPENIDEETREIPNTKLILGFPINQNGSAKVQSEQKVFAFLPTRSYGFKFMIQADFLVPASREDIHKDKRWNEWLRDNISTVFLESIKTFKNDENLKVTFYNYIPLQSEITDEFFLKVVEQLKAKLLESDCIFTESAKWLKPSQVFRASEEIRSLISNEELLEYFGKEFISKLVEDDVEPKILDFLEIENFSTSHLIKLLENTGWLERQSDEWLITLYAYLKKLDKDELNAVKKLKIIKLEKGLMESPVQPIFFSFGKKQVYGFEEQIPFIKNEIVRNNKEFLKNLGVLDPQPFEIIESYILKDFEKVDNSQNWQSRSEEVRIGYINYVKDNLDEYVKENHKKLNSGKQQWQKTEPLARLKNAIRIRYKTEEGQHSARPDNIYFSNGYDTKNNLEFLYSGIDNINFLHPQYLETPQVRNNKNEADVVKDKKSIKEGWTKFFENLGVQVKPIMYLQPSSYNQDKVYNSPIINKIIKDNNPNKGIILLKILDQNWSYYKNFTHNTIWYRPYGDGRYNLRDKREISEWYGNVTSAEWLPAKDEAFKEPSKLFLDKPEIRNVLGDSVFYLDAEIKNEDFRQALGINSEVKVETVLQTLKDLVNTKSEDKERFEKLYTFLNENYQEDELEINKNFRDENIIFVPGNSTQYISSGKAIWTDVTEIFGDYRSYLENHYTKLKDFFVGKIRIPEKPNAKNYADILVEISKKDSIRKTDEEKIIKIYKELNKFLKSDKSKFSLVSQEDWWKVFVANDIFWTNKFDFRRSNSVFVNDDKELYELFEGKSGVAFLKIPQDETSAFAPFIRNTELKYLSKKVKPEIVHSLDFIEAEKLTKQVMDLVIYIIRYLYHEENEIYEITKQDGKLLQLINLVCYGVEELSVKYTLHTESAYGDNVLFLDGNRLYVKINNFDSSDNLKSFDRISIELAKIFGYPKGLSDFIETLFFKSTEEKLEESLKTKKIGNLPQEEYEWFIKNSAQKIVGQESFNRSEGMSSFDNEVRDTNSIPRNDTNDPHQSIPDDSQNDSNAKNGKSGNTNRTVNKSVNNTESAKNEPSNQSQENRGDTSENKNNTTKDWSSEIDPWQVEINISELTLAEIKTATFNTGKVSKTQGKNSNDDDENEGSYQETLSQQAKKEIGRTGEIHALKALQNKFLGKYEKSELIETESGFNILVNSQIKVEIVWLNKRAEEGVGRDIEYTENGEKFFIEVKATKTNSKEIFQISRAEWELSKKEQENFSILRVYNAGTAQAECKEIRNPYQKWLEERLLVQSLTIRI